MKAEHRKELQTNMLADSVGRLLRSMRSAPKSSTIMIWVFVILVVGTYGLWQYYAHAAYTERSKLWTDFGIAIQDPENGGQNLSGIAQEGPGTIAGRTARFELARMSLQQGLEGLGLTSARDSAIKQLLQAREQYKELAKQCTDAPLLAQEAHMGVATVEEMLNGIPDPDHPETTCGSLERALDEYQKLAKQYPESPMGKLAAVRVKAIERDRGQVEKFYAELNQLVGPKEKPDARKQLEGVEKEMTEGSLKSLTNEQKDKLREAGKELERKLDQLPAPKGKPESNKK